MNEKDFDLEEFMRGSYKPTFIGNQHNTNCQQFYGPVINGTFNMPAGKPATAAADGKAEAEAAEAEAPAEAAQGELRQLAEGPRLTTRAERFAKAVAPFGFRELEKVKVLNARQQARLIEKMVKDACYAAAMLHYLEYYQRLRERYKMDSNEGVIKHCADALGCARSTYKDYYYSISSKTPYESYERHNARAFLDNGQVEADYREILEAE